MVRRARGRRPVIVAGLALVAVLTGCARPATTGASTAPGASASDMAASASGSPAPAGAGPIASSAADVVPGPSSSSASAAPVTGGAGRGGVSTPLPQCAAATLPTRRTGVLTVAAPDTLRPPWFSGSTPQAGGLEPAVIAAVATTLGFGPAAVHWVRVDPAAVTAGRAAGFDVAVAESPIPDQAGGPVDYSTGYFAVPTVIVARPDRAPAATLAALRTVRVAAAGSAPAVSAAIGSAGPVATFPTPAAALQAVRSGAVQVAAVDAVTALDARDLTVVGALAPRGETADRQLGLVLPHGSKLTSCLSTALDILRVQGTLASISAQWARLPILR